MSIQEGLLTSHFKDGVGCGTFKKKSGIFEEKMGLFFTKIYFKNFELKMHEKIKQGWMPIEWFWVIFSFLQGFQVDLSYEGLQICDILNLKSFCYITYQARVNMAVKMIFGSLTGKK